jgi:hypothetical protein
MFSQINLFEDDDVKTSKWKDDSAKISGINNIYKNTATKAVATGSITARHNKTMSAAVLSQGGPADPVPSKVKARVKYFTSQI